MSPVSNEPRPAPRETGQTHAEPSGSDAFEVHRQMVMALFIATGLVCGFVAWGLICSSFTILIVVCAAGALGGFVSALRRLYAFQRVFPPDFFTARHRIDTYLVVYSLIPPLVGAIAAVLLYVIFASEMLTGGFFPAFHDGAGEAVVDDPFRRFVEFWQPVGPTDYAKAIVWGFIAGFSERFVPDLLESLSRRRDPDERTPDAPNERPVGAPREGGAPADDPTGRPTIG